MNLIKKNSARELAMCLILAMALGNVSGGAPARYSKAADNMTGVNEAGTVSGGAIEGTDPSVSGGAIEGTDPSASGGAVVEDLTPYMPDAPQTVTARGGSKRVRLTWSTVKNADGYFIYMRSAAEEAFTKTVTIEDAAKLTWDVESLTQNTTYYFQVAAYKKVNTSVAEGKLSAIVSAKTASVAATSKTAKKYKTKSSFTSSPAYKKFTNMKNKMKYAKSFAIPGMKNANVGGFACTTMVPQAICYAGNYLLISAYDSKGVDYSVVYVVSKAAKSYITTIVLPSKAKVGGMAYDGTNIWISKGTSVACFPYSFVTDTVASGAAYKSLPAYTSQCKVATTASYIGYYDGILWVGPNKASATRMYGYSISDKASVPALTEKYSMAMPSRTQGIVFRKSGTMIITRSYRASTTKSGYISQIRTYKPSYANVSAAGKIKKNKAVAKNAMPPQVEGVAIYGSYTYTLFSSSASASCKYPVDRVIALKTSKLV